MKCRVCGRELDPTKSYCDKCGSPVDLNDSKDSGEFSWNTLDFPKPKKPKDIEISWPDMNRGRNNFMSVDASEGFVPSAGGFTAPQKSRAAEASVQQGFVRSQSVQQPVQPAQTQNFVPPQGFAQQGFVRSQSVQQPQSFSQPQMSWTMPMSAWSVPPQQQVVMPQPVQQPQSFVPPQGFAQQSYVQPQSVQQPQSYTQPVYVAPVYVPQQPAAAQVQTQPLYMTQSVPQTTLMPGIQMPQGAPQVVQQPVQQAAPHVQTHLPRYETPVLNQTVEETKKADIDDWLSEQLSDRTADDRFFTFTKQGEDFQKQLDAQYEKYRVKYDAEEPAKPEGKPQPDIEVPASKVPAKKAPEQTIIFEGENRKAVIPQNTEEMSKVSDSLFSGGEPLTDFDRMIVNGTTDPEDLGDSTLAISKERLREEIEEVSKKVEEAYSNVIESTDGLKDGKQKRLEAMAAARAAFFAAADAALEDDDSSTKKTRRGAAPVTEEKKEAPAEEPEAPAAEVPETPSAEAPEEEDAVSQIIPPMDDTIQAGVSDNTFRTSVPQQDINDLFEKWDRAYEEEEPEPEKKRHPILTLIIIILLFILADFLVLRFMSDGPVRGFFNKVNTKVEETVDTVKNKFSKKPAEENPLIAAAAEVNNHIGQITFDSAKSKYNANTQYDYGDDLKNSEAVSDEEILKKVVKTIVGYNSSWISYVNTTTDLSCLNYLKTDGRAYRAAATFDGLGKITEEYKKLNIGEIRGSEDFIYVFTDESIVIKENGSGTTVNSKMLYRLQLVNEDYKIIDYDTLS